MSRAGSTKASLYFIVFVAVMVYTTSSALSSVPLVSVVFNVWEVGTPFAVQLRMPENIRPSLYAIPSMA